MNNLTKFFEYKTREKEIAENWKEQNSFKYKQNAEPSFKIDTPPPTVSGSLHMGHVFSYVQADIIARYKRLTGRNVFYPIGFDDNGLPTERLVEKLTGKKVGRSATLEEFTKACFEVIKDAEGEFEELFTRIGLSVDFDLKYQTVSRETSYIAQNSFEDLYNKGLIYQKHAPVYFDTIDRTALAQADIEEKEMEGMQITYKALIETAPEIFEKVEIMTTRPEMLPNAVCVLFHPADERYKKYEGMKVLLPTLGLEYNPQGVPLIADEDVKQDKGTGLVMCCAFGDMQDKVWIERHNLWSYIPKRNSGGIIATNNNGDEMLNNLISDSGFLIDLVFKKEDGTFMKVEEGRVHMINLLLSKGYIVGSVVGSNLEEALQNPEIKVFKINHAVKCAERSGKPVEILFKKQWYLSALPFKKDLMEVIKKIDFHPSHFKIRLEQWIEGLNQDWCISRDRFFGINIPIYTFEFEDDVSRETLQNIQTDFYNEAFKSFAINSGCVFHDSHFEMESEVLANLMESPEYLEFENSFAQSGMDLEVKNIGINKYSIVVNRNLNGVLSELLTLLHVKHDEIVNQFLLKDTQVENLHKILQEKQETFEDIGIKNLRLKREGGVFDTWFTSSLSPSIAWKNFEETPVFDLRPQAHEIIRTWAFYTVLKSYLHSLELKSVEKKPDSSKSFNSREFFRMKENPNIIPWKNIMLSGWCLASDKTKMSKSKGNVITPTKLIEEKGVDVVRLWCASSSLGMDTSYNDDFLEVGKKFTNKLWNVAKFVLMKKEELNSNAEITESFDKWIVTEFNAVFSKYMQYMDKFEYSKAKEVLDNFFWKDVCDNYLEIIKVRYYGLEALIYKENPPANPQSVLKAQASCLQALNIIFKGILTLYSPFACFITEELHNIFYQSSLASSNSIQTLKLPTFANFNFNPQVLQIIEEVRKYKSENNLSMNSKIEEFSVLHVKHSDLEEYIEDLKNVTGVNDFKFV